jgi:8-oxo-dGTP pyrophosphatase MutT (NUDIX family)
MANSNLINRKIYYKIPSYIIDDMSMKLIKNKSVKSTKKQKIRNFIKNPYLTYENLKRLKNILEGLSKTDKTGEDYQSNKTDFILLGGIKTLNWVNQLLKSLRDPIERSKKAKSKFAGFENQFKVNHEKNFVKAPKLPKVNNISDLKPEPILEDLEPIEMKNASICLLFQNNKLLLLKRSADDEWMPNKYGLVGGGCNDNESPEKAIVREIKEETNIVVDKIKFCFSMIEETTFVYVFLGVVKQEQEIILDNENSEFIWATEKDLDTLDIIPNIKEIISKTYKMFLK